VKSGGDYDFSADLLTFPLQEGIENTAFLIAQLPEQPQAEEPPIQSALTDDTEFSDMEELPAPAPQTAAAPQEPQPLRKGRPKRKKGDGLFGLPHLLATFIWLAIILAIEGIQTLGKKKASK
jgi:hypothetical protein